MNALTIQLEALLRLGSFLGVFSALAIFEWCCPRRQLHFSKWRRWKSNISIGVLNTALTRVLIPLAGGGAAILAADRNYGLLNTLNLPGILEVPLFLLAFDLTIYLQHRLFHRVKLLWHLHRMHHTDPDYDLTTGNRFHPISVLLSGLIKIGLILLMGPTVFAVILAEVLLNCTSMFNHSNLRIPHHIDKWLRLVVVTPDMHRVHHSVNPIEHNCNFGFNFPWWDRLFGTYLDQPQAGHDAMSIGIEGFDDRDSTQFLSMLTQPPKTIR